VVFQIEWRWSIRADYPGGEVPPDMNGIGRDKILLAIRPAVQDDYPPGSAPRGVLAIDLKTFLRTMPYASYLHTPEWRQRRLAALKRAGYRCQLCNAAAPLEIHHRTYDRRGDEPDYDLIALCGECHGDHHARVRLRPFQRALN
jgi:hypothetical protein